LPPKSRHILFIARPDRSIEAPRGVSSRHSIYTVSEGDSTLLKLTPSSVSIPQSRDSVTFSFGDLDSHLLDMSLLLSAASGEVTRKRATDRSILDRSPMGCALITIYTHCSTDRSIEAPRGLPSQQHSSHSLVITDPTTNSTYPQDGIPYFPLDLPQL
jgi:hypothetical protein